jgi:RND family efflux transporter MFP subunit
MPPRICLAVLPVLALAGCQLQTPQPPPPPPPQVTVSRPVAREVPEYREYTGRLEAVETVEVRARVRGFLQKIHFQEGVEVKRGTLLYEIDPREFQTEVARAEAEVNRLAAQLRTAESEARRAEELRQTGAISTEEYIRLTATRDAMRAQLAQARAALENAKLTLSFTRITAPIDGRVGRTQVTEGNLVGSSEPTLLTTIVRMEPIYVTFEAPESDFLEYGELARQQGLPLARDVKVPVFVGLSTDQGNPHRGVLNYRDNRVDPGTGTILLRGELPNTDRTLTPGLFARVRVPFGNPQRRLLVPEVALGADQRGRFLLVVKPDDTVEYRKVVPGRPEGNLIVIEQGLKEDDRVVVNGLQKARPGAKVSPQEVPPGQSSATASTSAGANGGR